MALCLLAQMPAARVIPNVLSFSAGISACEKGGQWQMALCLLAQMPAARVIPNVLSLNAGISACEKGGEWQMALCLLAQMPAATVIPNAISFNAGIQACGTARQWRMALSVFSCLVSNGQTPDCNSYTQVLDAVYPERLGFRIFRKALEGQAWPNMLCSGGTHLDLHHHSSGSAMLAVLWWFAEIIPLQIASGKSLTSFRIITGWGKSRSSLATSDLRASVLHLLDRCEIPCRVHPTNQGLVQVDLRGSDVVWLRALFPKAAMAGAD